MCPCRYAAQIACVLRDEPNLTAIDLSANRLQQPTAAILQALTAHSNLTSLNLSDNGMTDEPLTCLVRRCVTKEHSTVLTGYSTVLHGTQRVLTCLVRRCVRA